MPPTNPKTRLTPTNAGRAGFRAPVAVDTLEKGVKPARKVRSPSTSPVWPNACPHFKRTLDLYPRLVRCRGR
ncbi:hypothetical protein AZA_54365 [Nitrospirillum viridazoti Y2]|nr:hypothetical protein AZA_54365 [Nitrospirillum amazonense Y2]